MTPASSQLKKGRVKLGHVLELPPDTSVSELTPELVGKEAWTAEFRWSSSPRRFHSYAPLNAPKTQVLMEIREQLPRPKKMCTYLEKHNPNKFCLYHHDHGHDMEECIQL